MIMPIKPMPYPIMNATQEFGRASPESQRAANAVNIGTLNKKSAKINACSGFMGFRVSGGVDASLFVGPCFTATATQQQDKGAENKQRSNHCWPDYTEVAM